MTGLPVSAAAVRNADPILGVLRDLLRGDERVLEIGSGSGQHVVRFAAALPATRWQPSETPAMLKVLQARLDLEGGDNIAPAIELDVMRSPTLPEPFDACLSVNTLHILSLNGVAALFDRAARALVRDGLLLVYGPVRMEGAHTGDGNRRFDAALRQGDPEQGIRDLETLDELASGVGFDREAVLTMPADNRMMVWRRRSD